MPNMRAFDVLFKLPNEMSSLISGFLGQILAKLLCVVHGANPSTTSTDLNRFGIHYRQSGYASICPLSNMYRRLRGNPGIRESESRSRATRMRLIITLSEGWFETRRQKVTGMGALYNPCVPGVRTEEGYPQISTASFCKRIEGIK